MALTVWTSAKYATLPLFLKSGAGVSVAVVASGSTSVLKWKREKQDGTWPTDAQAVPIATLSSPGVFAMLQFPDGRILIGDGISRFWIPRTNDPHTQGDFQVVNVL